MESKTIFDSDRESGVEDGNSGFPGRENFNRHITHLGGIHNPNKCNKQKITADTYGYDELNCKKGV